MPSQAALRAAERLILLPQLNKTATELLNARAEIIDAEFADVRLALEEAGQLSGGWREAVVELEDFCSEPVRLKNMVAAADQIDRWQKEARVALAKVRLNA